MDLKIHLRGSPRKHRDTKWNTEEKLRDKEENEKVQYTSNVINVKIEKGGEASGKKMI